MNYLYDFFPQHSRRRVTGKEVMGWLYEQARLPSVFLFLPLASPGLRF